MVSLPSTTLVAAHLRHRLPKSVFEPARSRLLWLPVHFLVAAGAMVGIALSELLLVRLGLSLLVGVCFAGLAFVAHEALHGALCRRSRLRKWIGFLGFLPFCLSPRLWTVWHNRVHHGNTNRQGRDPDAMATLEEYKENRLARLSSELQYRCRGVFTLLVGFSLQSLQILLTARQRKLLPERHFRAAVRESLVGWLVWGALLWAVGPGAFAFAYVLPLLLANAIVMAHILTNHGLRPADDSNHPLLSSTSVTVPRLFSWLTLDFGYHTEHHLFPAMSHRHGPEVSKLLAEHYPEHYHKLPLSRALLSVCKNPRVFLNSETLIVPGSGRTVKLRGPQSSSRNSGAPPAESWAESCEGRAMWPLSSSVVSAYPSVRSEDDLA